jgi:hypothetical protein
MQRYDFYGMKSRGLTKQVPHIQVQFQDFAHAQANAERLAMLWQMDVKFMEYGDTQVHVVYLEHCGEESHA